MGNFSCCARNVAKDTKYGLKSSPYIFLHSGMVLYKYSVEIPTDDPTSKIDNGLFVPYVVI